nr:sensor histidine kinase [Allomuricauda sp.]
MRGLVLLFFFGQLVCGQELDIIHLLRSYKLESATESLPQYSDTTADQLQWQIEFLKTHKALEPAAIDSGETTSSPDVIARFYAFINQGDFKLARHNNLNIEALDSYKSALGLAKKVNNKVLICEALKKILSFHRLHYLYDNVTYLNYLDDYDKWAYDDLERAHYHYFNLILNFKNYYVEKWNQTSYNWLIDYFETNDQPFLKAIAYNVFASYFEETGEMEKVWYFIHKAEDGFSKIPFAYKKIRENQLYVFAGRIAAKENDVKKLEAYLSKFDSEIPSQANYQFRSLYYFYSSVLDTLKGNYRSAYKNYYDYEVAQDSLRRFRYNNLLNELETKYQTSEKEKQFLEQKQKTQINRNLLMVAGIVFFLGTGLAILFQKNTTKKRRIAEQEVELRQQRVENLLKEQELMSIDAMISGQEKERQKVANELHDDLGSLMATIKLHFDNAQVSKKDPALQNAQNLLEEAYQKIRGMAHSKNSGVMSDQGLLPAVKNMATVISESNTLKVSVEEFGLGDRLENSLELTIFRIIQELVANIIKHAEATKASIQFTQHEDTLNIIVEDNGKGFDISKVEKTNNGMGLTNIEKRVEHLEGGFTVDSVLGKGTSILIDIPV